MLGRTLIFSLLLTSAFSLGGGLPARAQDFFTAPEPVADSDARADDSDALFNAFNSDGPNADDSGVILPPAEEAMGTNDLPLQNENLDPPPAVADGPLLSTPAEEASSSLTQVGIPALDMSLSSMVLFALHDNPDIGISKAQKDQAYHTIDEARDPLYPQLSFGLEAGYGYNNPAGGKDVTKKSNVNWSNEASFSLTQLIFDGFAGKNTVKRRYSEYEASQYQVDITVQQVVTETIGYYIDIYRNQRAMADIEAFVDQINRIVNTVSLREQEGAASQVKLEYARARLASAKSQLTDTYSALNDAISNLEFLVGKLPRFNAQAPDELILDDNVLSQFVDYGYKNSPEIKQNKASYDAFEYSAKAAEGAFAPEINFSLEGSRGHDDGGEVGPTTELSGTFRLDYELFGLMGRRATVNKAKARANELVITEKKLQKELKRDIQLLYNQMTSNRQLLKETEDELASNIRLQEFNRQNFELGDIDIIELIEGEERLISSKRNKYDLEAELYRGAYDLLLKIGYLDKDYFCNEC